MAASVPSRRFAGTQRYGRSWGLNGLTSPAGPPTLMTCCCRGGAWDVDPARTTRTEMNAAAQLRAFHNDKTRSDGPCVRTRRPAAMAVPAGPGCLRARPLRRRSPLDQLDARAPRIGDVGDS